MAVAERVAEQVVMSGDAALFVRSVGGHAGGPTLITLHGGPGISHDYLLPLAQLADERLQVIFYDQRQVGRSTGIAATTEPLQEWADDLEAVRKGVGAEKIHLLAHSAGGFPAIAYGSRYPERVQSLIFVDSIPPIEADLSQAWTRMLKRMSALQAAGLLPAELTFPKAEESPAVISPDSAAVTPDDGTPFLRAFVPFVHFVKPATPDALQGATYRPIAGDRLMKALGNFDLRPQVASLTMPTLTFIAPIPFGTEMASALYDALPKENARAIVLKECGHFPWAESPQLFFSEVRSFLAPFLPAQ
jgi:proline iminopeptidase